MNNQTPLSPLGSFQEQKNNGRARVRIAVFVVLAIHGIGLLALLIVGCKKEPDVSQTQSGQATNGVASQSFDATNTGATPTNESVAPANPASAPAAVTAPPATSAPPVIETPALPATATDYKIVQGDNFSTLSKKFHVTVKAIEDANPGVEPTKLKIGQTLHIPAPVITAATLTSPGALSVDASGEQLYTVKSGDTLGKIAADHKVSLKALRSANTLTTDKIKVGQKLKIPSKATATNGTGNATGAGVAPTGTTISASTVPAH